MIEDAVADPLDAERVKQEVARRLFGAPLAPLRIGRFEVKERIGAGGMSVVYRAHDPELGRDVAIKLLQAGGRSERLRREARVLAKLRHPHVVTVYEVGSWREHAFVALEHVVGSTLAEWSRDRGHDAIARCVVEVARGLDAVHRLGVVHRDVKPANIVVDASGAARLIDFGLVSDERSEPDASSSSSPSTSATLTREGATPGTPRYMAPELAAGAPSSPRSDQYSLGVTLDEVTRGAPRSPELERVIARATHTDPAQRFDDLAALADALAAPARRAIDPRVVVAIVAALAIAGLTAFALTRGTGATRPPEITSTDAWASSDPAWIVALTRGSDRADARQAQRRGLLAYRAGDDAGAISGFEEALAIDATYGAAELGLAMLFAQGTMNEARPHFARALGARAGASDEARVLVEALRPCIEDEPIDAARCEASLVAATTAHGDQPLLFYELARQRRHREGFSEAIVDAFGHALALDPQLSRALVAQAQTLAYLGRFDEALVMTERCLDAAPTTTSCHRDRVWIQQALGDCEGVEASARRWRAIDPTNPHPLWALAGVAERRGESSVLEQLLSEARARLEPENRVYLEARDPVVVAISRGDFDAAARGLEGFDARAFAEPGGPSADRFFRLVPARLGILVAREIGDPERARELAEDALARMGAWPADPRVEDFGIAHDATPFLLDVLRETGSVDDLTRIGRRAEWFEAWRDRTSAPYLPFAWMSGYAAQVDDAVEAAEASEAAVDLRAAGLVTPPPFHPLAYPDLGLGQLARHEGRVEDAIAILGRAAGSCHAPGLDGAHETWWQRPRAMLALGEVLEARGDRDAACVRYADVLARWGAAQTRSVTAERAREHVDALGCAR